MLFPSANLFLPAFEYMLFKFGGHVISMSRGMFIPCVVSMIQRREIREAVRQKGSKSVQVCVMQNTMDKEK